MPTHRTWWRQGHAQRGPLHAAPVVTPIWVTVASAIALWASLDGPDRRTILRGPKSLDLVECMSEASPDGMQHLLARSVWDTDGVRDDLRDYVVEHLGAQDAVFKHYPQPCTGVAPTHNWPPEIESVVFQ